VTLADKLREVEEVRNSVREGRATYVEALAALMQIDLPDPEVDPLDADYTQYFRAEDAEHQRDELAAALRDVIDQDSIWEAVAIARAALKPAKEKP